MPPLLLLVVLAIAAVLIYRFVLPRTSGNSSRQAAQKSGKFGDMQVSPRLWQKLVKLTKDETTAQRLVRGLLLRYPDRDADWCCEKAIYDIERDRNRS
jgi:hypothetical protein